MNKEQAIEKLLQLVDKYGYWSREVNEFNEKLEYGLMIEVNNHVLSGGN